MSSTNLKGIITFIVVTFLIIIVLAGCGGSSATPLINNNYVAPLVENTNGHFEPVYDLFMEFEQIMEAPEIPGTGESIKELSFPMERPPKIPDWVADTATAKREYVRMVIEAQRDGPQSFVRNVSATGTQYHFDGADFSQSYGCVDDGNSAVLTANGETVYAMYSLPGILEDRPVTIEVNLSVDSGEVYIAVANYTTGRWDFWGPFESDTVITINSDTVIERYLSATNTLHYAILTYDDGEAQIVGSVIDAYPVGQGAFSTKPHMPLVNSIGVRGDGDKSPSTLDESQYTDIYWDHLYDPGDPNSEALTFSSYREDPGATNKVEIGNKPDNNVGIPYTDPTDNDIPEESETTPGEKFIYTAQSVNQTGLSAFTAEHSVVIPLNHAIVTNWQHTWGTDVDETGNSITVDDLTGDIYIASNYQVDDIEDPFGIDVRKYDRNGVLQWAKIWNASHSDIVNNIYLDSKGYLHLVGKTDSFGVTNSYDFLWLKYNASTGELIHSKTFGSDNVTDEWATNILEDSNGDFLIGGYSRLQLGGDIVVLKYSGEEPHELLDKSYIGGTNKDVLVDMKIDIAADGTSYWLYLLAYTESFHYGGPADEDVLVIRLRDTLEEDWVWHYGDTHNQRPIGFDIDSAKNRIYVVGSTATIAGPTDVFLLTISFTGGLFNDNPRWGTDGFNNPTSMVYDQANDNHVVYISVSMDGDQYSTIIGYEVSGLVANLQLSQQCSSTVFNNIWLDNTSKLYMTGWATDNTGLWSPFSGNEGDMTFSGDLIGAGYHDGEPAEGSGNTIDQVGTDANAPFGVTNTGGGGSDIFFAKIDAP